MGEIFSRGCVAGTLFGYVMPYAPELKVKYLEAYKGAYCGLCKELGRQYGIFSRFLLNYDLLFLALLQDGMAAEAPGFCRERCIAHPFHKRQVCKQTAGLTHAADALILLAYYKWLDTIADEGFFKRTAARLCKPFFERWHRQAAARRPQLDNDLRAASEKQFALEKANTANLDAAAEPTGMMVSAIFAECRQEEREKRILKRLGMFAGQVIYLLDAAEDYEEDRRKGRYNPLVLLYDDSFTAKEAAKARIQMARGEMALCYNLLEFPLYKELLDNILFLGLGIAAEHAGTKINPMAV